MSTLTDFKVIGLQLRVRLSEFFLNYNALKGRIINILAWRPYMVVFLFWVRTKERGFILQPPPPPPGIEWWPCRNEILAIFCGTQ